MNNFYEIDERVIDLDGYKGTIKYVGPVATAKNKDDIWLGVEWDNPQRGKHDGSCSDENGNVYRYFSCDSTSGSFIKQNKLGPTKSLCDALKLRYVDMDAPIIAPDSKLPDAFVMTSKGNQKSIELIGEKNIRKWQQINVVNKVVLRNESISSIGNDINELARSFELIDLQDNLLYKWSEIAFLCSQVPSLHSLLFHGNKFQTLSNIVYEALPKICFVNLKLLALNNCRLSSWIEVELLSELSPNLEELYLAGNYLGDLPNVNFHIDDSRSSSKFSNLRVLDVSFSGIESWFQIKYFESYPSLEELVLDNNSIDTIFPNTESGFRKLFRLSISSTKINSWYSIDALSTYKTLQQLRLSHVPLFQGKGASEVRPKVIAKIKQLQYFNGSGISPKERVDSEKNYLRSIQRDLTELKTENEKIEFLRKEHPRYDELLSSYKNDLIPLAKSSDGLTLASEIINVTFRNMSFSSNGTLEPIAKKIPCSVTIARLKMIVKQLIGLDIKLQQLSLLQAKDALPVLLEDDQCTLQYYGATDNAQIYINETKPDNT